MTQENKKLLLQDLCERIPYGVILKTDNVFPQKLEGISFDKDDTFVFLVSDGGFTLDYMDCKPYLFPLSSMTEEQKVIYGDLCYAVIHSLAWNMQAALNELVDWLNKNHFDYRGLIPMGLGIDATELNIY